MKANRELHELINRPVFLRKSDSGFVVGVILGMVAVALLAVWRWA